MNKTIKDDDAIATIEFKKGLLDDIINKIDSIISKNYDQECEFIIKLDKNHYKGDMACLSGLAWDVIDNLNQCIIKYVLFNKPTNETEDFIMDLR